MRIKVTLSPAVTKFTVIHGISFSWVCDEMTARITDHTINPVNGLDSNSLQNSGEEPDSEVRLV